MKYNVLVTSGFKKENKRLSKKYKSLKKEILELIELLEDEPEQGTSLGEKCYKIRIAIKSKGKGKSGGARIITHLKLVENNVFLISIYDKSEQGSISDKEIKKLIKAL